ncbi:hypothetical protein L687_11150 [Microbacterium maritypicum MF109]|uniref:Uncharacterized protein n=1 Tax=Microbacterium maritypicum MF109 TaxID=1333857 RepID=T5L0E7_MICMQ|nr:hypothetical protein L687_11150 [Microbacterium maritypicum MF109]
MLTLRRDDLDALFPGCSTRCRAIERRAYGGTVEIMWFTLIFLAVLSAISIVMRRRSRK